MKSEGGMAVPRWRKNPRSTWILLFGVVALLLLLGLDALGERLGPLPATWSLGLERAVFLLALALLVWLVFRFWPSQLVVVLFNLGFIVLILYGFELYLASIDPARNLPFNGMDQNGNRYSWGQLVVNNRYGFREREFQVPKPAGVYRIMVLGDSLTWGVGLSLEERYTNLLEKKLAEAFPDKRVEVLDFALEGASTIREREFLRQYKDAVSPDLIVVGFCLNDPQPKSQEYSIERENFIHGYGALILLAEAGLKDVGLPHVSARLDTAATNILQKLSVLPPWQTGMERVYDTNSLEWAGFVQALRDIKQMNDEMGLPPPVFLVLDQGTSERGTDYGHPQSDPQLVQFLRWYRQAEQAARQVGFITANEEDLLAANPGRSMVLNVLDGHPNAWTNRIYAERLFELIGGMIERGELFK